MRGGLPDPRSGHTVSIHKDVMLIFGGIKEITRETNDMYTFNLTTGIWGPIQFEI